MEVYPKAWAERNFITDKSVKVLADALQLVTQNRNLDSGINFVFVWFRKRIIFFSFSFFKINAMKEKR